MQCPVCDIEMEPGEVRIQASALGFLIIGFSYKNLWFVPSHPDGTPDKVDHLARSLILRNSENTEAHRCEICGATLLLPDCRSDA
jgi:hypothetical protein